MPAPLNPRKPDAAISNAALEAVKLLETTLLQSTVVELSHAAQSEAAPDILKRIYQEFEASLTDSQRQQLASGGVSAKSLTPAQVEILKTMEPYLQGLTIVELSHAARNEAAPDELKRIYHEFQASLTDSQQQQLATGGVSAESLTPAQVEILRKMEPYLQGLSPEQLRLLGLQDGIREAQERYGREHDAGPAPANPTILPYAVGLLLLLMIALILFMLRAC